MSTAFLLPCTHSIVRCLSAGASDGAVCVSPPWRTCWHRSKFVKKEWVSREGSTEPQTQIGSAVEATAVCTPSSPPSGPPSTIRWRTGRRFSNVGNNRTTFKHVQRIFATRFAEHQSATHGIGDHEKWTERQFLTPWLPRQAFRNHQRLNIFSAVTSIPQRQEPWVIQSRDHQLVHSGYPAGPLLLPVLLLQHQSCPVCRSQGNHKTSPLLCRNHSSEDVPTQLEASCCVYGTLWPWLSEALLP